LGATKAMEDGKVANAPVQFFAIGQDVGFDFILATSAESAINQYVKWVRSNDAWSAFSHKFKVDVWKAELNKFGVLESTDVVISGREIEC
jgi:hypothetical protein